MIVQFHIRVHKNFIHSDVAISAGVQQMVRSDMGSSGVMFTIDTESGFKDVIFITSSYGLVRQLFKDQLIQMNFMYIKHF